MGLTHYIVISPVRNEELYLPATIASMVNQHIRPTKWILVDDGSSDKTGSIIDTAAICHEWIKAIHRGDRGFRQAGGGVMEAFYEGYRTIGKDEDWHYLVKFDADLTFPPDYFEQCFRRFEANPQLGIGGGAICNLVNGELEVESKVDPQFHVRGATKIYRRACWGAIGGLLRTPGWDTVDEVKANMLGWTSCTFADLKLVHHRIAGGAYGQWSNLIKNGSANYVAGYHPAFMLLKCVRRLFNKPYFVEALGLWCGFVGGYVRRMPRADDKEMVKYFRRQQLNRMLGRKSLWS